MHCAATRPALCILQARSELLTGLSAVLASQGPEGAFDLADMQLLLKWLNALARHPTGADDVTPVPGVLPPVQKLVLQILAHLNTVSAAAVGGNVFAMFVMFGSFMLHWAAVSHLCRS
jgi:hypothetical protein